jgi:ATP-binding cassette, subfamily B, bacterial
VLRTSHLLPAGFDVASMVRDDRRNHNASAEPPRGSVANSPVRTLGRVPGSRFHGFASGEAPERPADKAVRRANLRRIAHLFRPYRVRLAGVCALILVSAALGVVSPFLLRAVLDTAIPDARTGLLTALVAGMIAIAVITGALGVVQTLHSNKVGQRVMHDLRTAVYRHLQRLSLAFFTRTRTGEVQSRIANDIGGVDDVVTSTATSVVSNVTTVLATMVAMILLDWRLAVFALALVPVFVFMTRRVGEARRKVTTVRQGAMADISSLVQESLSVSGILLGKTMGRAGELAERFEGESERLADLEVRSRMTGRWMMASIQTTFAVMPALVYWFAGMLFAHGNDAISIGTLVAFTTLQTRLFFPIGSLLGVQVEVQSSLALFDRIFEYLDLRVDIEDGRRTIPEPRGEVSLEHVWFRYDDSAWTLEDVSFEVAPGTKTAIVGETGSGKTTVAYLVSRLYDASDGTVAIDGVDVRELTFASLAATVGVVSQETYLFHATVRENLRFAKPDASDDEIEAAARTAQIHELIATLPDGYDTVVGERGYRFSGGEKQRIAIARTVLRNPPVLVLDEATSSLDTQTERLVQEALERLAEGRTTIAIAHRLSTVRDADQIVVLDRGRVVERGTHEELLSAGGRYTALLTRDSEMLDIV